MGQTRHQVPFSRVKAPSFASAKRLADDLRGEKEFWLSFDFRAAISVSGRQGEPAYDKVIAAAENGIFSTEDGKHAIYATWIFPHRATPEGMLLQALLRSNDFEAAQSMLFSFFNEEGWLQGLAHQPESTRAVHSARLGEGRTWLSLARLGFVRRDQLEEGAMSSLRDRIETEVVALEALMDQSRETLSQVTTIHQEIVGRSRHKLAVLDRWRSIWVASINTKSAKNFESWQLDWEQVRTAFIDELKYRAPIAHWKIVAEEHEKRANVLLGIFVFGVLALALGSVWISLLYGDTIAEAFHPSGCSSSTDGCETSFSPKGPMLISSFLLATSLSVWLLRLVSKMHISERHLARAAVEKRSFTEAFLALTKEQSVGEEQAAIVMNAIFRPSQDGFVKDDDGGVDLSSSALLARILSGKQ